MGRTVDFYTNVLGMPLVKTIELPDGMGQHFFFDCGEATVSPSSGSPGPRRGPGHIGPGGPPRPG
jgi:catechol 2,3-dioxygenase-like lactoylglutathione lyase family enzyme